MDQQPTYEQLIAAKLVNLPIPDMADAIWSRIEKQLDIDMPTDDRGNDPSPSAPAGPRIIGWGLSLVLVALVTVFLIFKNKQKTNNENPGQNRKTEQAFPPSEKATSQPVIPDKENNSANQPGSGVITPKPDIPVDSGFQTNAPLVVPPADSIKADNIEPAVALPAIKDTAPIIKKRRGVSGLTDSDYRIVPKKDST